MNILTQSDTIDAIQGKAKNELIEEILSRASNYLRGSQLMDLNRILNECFDGYEIFVDNGRVIDENYEDMNKNILDSFIQTKKVEGASQRTTYYYHSIILKLIEWADMPLPDITTEKIREYFSYYQSLNNCSNATLDNTRRVFSVFFTFCLDEGYIQRNPMRRIKKIKSQKQVKEAFTDIELEKMRDYLSNMPKKTRFQEILRIRNRAIFELLLSSGIRLSECVSLNKEDLNMENNSFRVLGKGNKERMCYFSAKAKYWLQQLLDYRLPKKYVHPDNPALFINYQTGARYEKNGLGRMIRDIGKSVGVKSHPHKFRRTFATTLIRKEVPIEQVKELMGHSNMDTTMIYTILDQEQIKMNHNRYSG